MSDFNKYLSTGNWCLDMLLLAGVVVLVVMLISRYALWGYCEEYSSVDGIEHKVQCDYNDKQKASDLLAQLNKRAVGLINYLKGKYYNEDNDRGMLTRNLVKRYRGPSRLVETDPNNGDGDTSYTLDKGYLVSMCLRKSKDKNSDEFHSINTLTFVLIHELTHIAANVDQHPPRFWDVFKWLLTESVEVGIYIPVEYSLEPIKSYCSRLNIDYSPYYDKDLKPICCD